MEELCRRWRNQFHTSEQLKKHRGITESNILLKWVCDSPKHGVILLKIDTAQIRQQGFLREMLGCVCVTVYEPFSPTRGSSLLCPLCSTVQDTWFINLIFTHGEIIVESECRNHTQKSENYVIMSARNMCVFTFFHWSDVTTEEVLPWILCLCNYIWRLQRIAGTSVCGLWNGVIVLLQLDMFYLCSLLWSLLACTGF